MLKPIDSTSKEIYNDILYNIIYYNIKTLSLCDI